MPCAAPWTSSAGPSAGSSWRGGERIHCGLLLVPRDVESQLVPERLDRAAVTRGIELREREQLPPGVHEDGEDFVLARLVEQRRPERCVDGAEPGVQRFSGLCRRVVITPEPRERTRELALGRRAMQARIAGGGVDVGAREQVPRPGMRFMKLFDRP